MNHDFEKNYDSTILLATDVDWVSVEDENGRWDVCTNDNADHHNNNDDNGNNNGRKS